MKISLITKSLDKHGGAERVIGEQLRGFSERGAEVHIVAPTIEEDVLNDYNVPENVFCHTYKKGKIRTILTIRDHINTYSPDIVLSHYRNKAAFLASKISNYQPKLTSHVHGTLLWFPDDKRHLAHQKKRGYQRLVSEVPGHKNYSRTNKGDLFERFTAIVEEKVEEIALQNTSEVFVDTRQVKRELELLYNTSSTIARPGVSQSWIDNQKSTKEINIHNREKAILSVCRLDRRKRLDLLIKAFSGIENNDDIGLVIAGTGEQRDYLQNLAASLGVEQGVKFAGFVPESELASYYKSADVFVCPGWMSYGITPIEAYAMKTPIAISTDAFAHEVIGDSPAVRVLEPSKNAWTEGLSDLLSSSSQISDTNITPTWEEFNELVFKKISE